MSILGGGILRGASYLTYTWSETSKPSDDTPDIVFSDNGTNAGKNTTATFFAAGTYHLICTVDNNGASVDSNEITVTVNQTASSIAVDPGYAEIGPDDNPLDAVTATELDQFGDPMPTANQPTFNWTTTTAPEAGQWSLLDEWGSPHFGYSLDILPNPTDPDTLIWQYSGLPAHSAIRVAVQAPLINSNGSLYYPDGVVLDVTANGQSLPTHSDLQDTTLEASIGEPNDPQDIPYTFLLDNSGVLTLTMKLTNNPNGWTWSDEIPPQVQLSAYVPNGAFLPATSPSPLPPPLATKYFTIQAAANGLTAAAQVLQPGQHVVNFEYLNSDFAAHYASTDGITFDPQTTLQNYSLQTGFTTHFLGTLSPGRLFVATFSNPVNNLKVDWVSVDGESGEVHVYENGSQTESGEKFTGHSSGTVDLSSFHNVTKIAVDSFSGDADDGTFPGGEYEYVGFDNFTYTIATTPSPITGVADLRVDSNNNGTIDPTPASLGGSNCDDAIEDQPGLPGVIIPVNADDDNHDGIMDYQEFVHPKDGEDDLVQMNLHAPEGMTSGTLRLTLVTGADHVRVWNWNPVTNDTEGPILGWRTGQTSINSPYSGTDPIVYLEGVHAASAMLGDISFLLEAIPTGDTQPVSQDTVRATVANVKVSSLVVNQDVPTNSTFTPLVAGSDGAKVVYGGSEAGTSDDLKFVATLWPAGLNPVYSWSVSKPGTVQNAPPTPGANATIYTAGNIAAKPGNLVFAAQATIGSRQIQLQQTIEVGVRTDDVIVASWIDPTKVPPPVAGPGVGTDILAAFPSSPVRAPTGLQLAAAGVILTALQAGIDSPPRSTDLPGVRPLTVAERTYIVDWLFIQSANANPGLALAGNNFRDSGDTGTDETKVANFRATATNYKLFNRLQIRYRVGKSGFKGAPVILHQGAAVGETVNPLGFNVFPYSFGGQTGPAITENVPFANSRHVSSIVDGSPDAAGVRSFDTLFGVGVTSPLWWENIGNRITFVYNGNIDDSLTRPDLVFQPYPTHYVYFNGKLSPIAGGKSAAQAPSPLGNFNTRPYPFGPGGRGGDGHSTPAPAARVPLYAVP